MLRLIDRAGGFDEPAIAPERAEDRPEVRALIRRAGAEGMVLLKNDGVLPLAPRAGQTLALIGPNACTAQIMGGGARNSIRTIASRRSKACARSCLRPLR